MICMLLFRSISNSMPQPPGFCIVNFLDVLSCIFTSDECRIQKDLVDQEKFQATLNDETLATSCDLKRALEMVAILEAQLKEMNPNLDSISEYDFSLHL